MASPEDIRTFIDQQRQAGAFDSSGRFSLDLRKARQKSELLHQDTSGAHALLWVQATNYLHPHDVRLAFDSVEVRGEIPFGLEELREIVAGSKSLPPRQRALSRAIQACSTLSQGTSLLSYRHRRHGQVQVNVRSGAMLDDAHPARQNFDSVRLSFPRQGTAWQRAEELRQIESRCGFSPSRPRYDSRSLVDENPDGYRARPPCRTSWNVHTHPSYLLAVQEWKTAAGHIGFLNPGLSEAVFLREREGQFATCERLVALPLGLEGPGSVRLVQRGVLVEEVEFDLGVPGAWAIVCADSLQTDLSGLKLVRDNDFSRVLVELQQHTRQLAQRALAQLESFHLPAPEHPPGLLERLSHWVFPVKNHGSGETDCREEVRYRLRQALL